MKIQRPQNLAQIVMERLYDAPILTVWQVLTYPDCVMVWFGGDGFTNPVCEMDVRQGGIWHHVMRTPDGANHIIDSVFTTVQAPKHLEWQNADYGKSTDRVPPPCHYAVTLTELESQTAWTLVANFETPEARDAADAMGFTEILSQGCERFNNMARALK